MKKMILLAVVAVLAFAGQAASVSWSATLVGQGTTLVGNNAFVMVFAGSDYADIVKLVTVDGSDTLQADLAAKALNTPSTFVNVRNSGNTNGTINDSPSSVFWMIFSEGSYDAGKAVTWTVATDVSGAFHEPPATGIAFIINASSFANTGTIANVPEPTSAMLLVLGMAGLALRRKRA